MITGNSPFQLICCLHIAVSATTWAEYWSWHKCAASSGLLLWCLHLLLNFPCPIHLRIIILSTYICTPPKSTVEQPYIQLLQWVLGIQLGANMPLLSSSWVWPYYIGYIAQSNLCFHFGDSTIWTLFQCDQWSMLKYSASEGSKCRFKSLLKDWRDGSGVKLAYCFCRGPKCNLHHPYEVAHNHLYTSQVSKDAAPMCSYSLPHIHIIQTKNKS